MRRTSFGQLLRWFTQHLDFFPPSDSRFSNSCMSKYCYILTNHINGQLIYQLSDDVEISISKNVPLCLVLWSMVTCMCLPGNLDVKTKLFYLFFGLKSSCTAAQHRPISISKMKECTSSINHIVLYSRLLAI